MRVISICCLIVLVNQCSFSCKDYCNYNNDNENISKIVNNDLIYNINTASNNHNNFLENCKIILINKKDIKKGDSKLVNKVIICNGKILNDDKLIPGDCYKVIIKKPNNKRIFEKLINNNKNKEDIDVLASFRLEQIIKNFKNLDKKQDNTKDWREEFWSDRTLIMLDSKENSITECSTNQTINNSLFSKQNILNDSINEGLQSKCGQSEYNTGGNICSFNKNSQILDNNIQSLIDNNEISDNDMQIKIDRLNRLHKEFAIKNGLDESKNYTDKYIVYK